MSSINTNLGAMVALDTLKGINKNLGMVQNEISTGKSINSAKDNAAIWSIATVMETDVAGFEQIGNSLNLGSATVGVARVASEEVVTELKSIRDNIIAAQESNVDRGKIQDEIAESVKQIGSVVSAAQFNGQNLLNEAGSVSVLSSLDRSSDGTVAASKITVNKVNLSSDAAVDEVVGVTAQTAGDAVTGVEGDATVVAAGGALDTDGGPSALVNETAITIASIADAGNTTYSIEIQGETITYEASDGDTQDEVAAGLAAAINTSVADGGSALNGSTLVAASTGGVVDFTADASNGDFGVSAFERTVTADVAEVEAADAVAAGGLNALNDIDVETDEGATAALTAINTMLDTAIDAAAAFGSKQGRIDKQIDFVSSLGDSLKAGISTLTDANLEEASARLQALQVQQQLGVQALSIANQAPQALLGLFR